MNQTMHVNLLFASAPLLREDVALDKKNGSNGGLYMIELERIAGTRRTNARYDRGSLVGRAAGTIWSTHRGVT